MNKKKGNCPQCGRSGVTMQNSKECMACYMRKYRKKSKQPEKTKTITHEPKPQGDSEVSSKQSLIDKILGSRTVKSEPKDLDAMMGKTKTDGKTGGQPPPSGDRKQTSQGVAPVSPALFLLIASRLNRTFETKDWELSREEAEYMAELLGSGMAAHGAKMDPMVMFAITILVWIVPPLFIHVPKKLGMDKDGSKPFSWKDLFSGRRKKEEKSSKTMEYLPPPTVTRPSPEPVEIPPPKPIPSPTSTEQPPTGPPISDFKVMKIPKADARGGTPQ